MKIAQQIAGDFHSNASGAAAFAEKHAIAADQVLEAELTKYTFADNSVLAISGPAVFGMDADDAASIRAYGEFAGDSESAEVERLLEALES